MKTPIKNNINPSVSNNLVARFFQSEREALRRVLRNKDNQRVPRGRLIAALSEKAKQQLRLRNQTCLNRIFRRVFKHHDANHDRVTEELSRWLCVAVAHDERTHPVAEALLIANNPEPTEGCHDVFY